MASTNSVKCAALIGVVPPVRVLSVNVLEKTAVTDLAAFIMTKQAVLLLPLHESPRHSRKAPPDPALAVRVIVAPVAKFAAQVVVQAMIPDGALLTLPELLPVTATERMNELLKVAVTVRAWVMLAVHVPVPLQPSPLQPPKANPFAAVAVRMTLAP